MQTIAKDNCRSVTMLMTLPLAGGEILDLLYLMESKTLASVTSLNDTQEGGE